MAEENAATAVEPSASDIRLVIAASSAGTIFEWYDFFIYGTLAAIIGKAFFPADNATLQILLVWAGFAVGFGFRPLGAILFGFLGDKLGRKYTFLVTVTLMGVATAGVGLIPSAASIGLWAPAIVILLRILQGLALGGEYGGAAIYVSEHAAADRRGYFSSYIQASVVGGFVLSIIVVLLCQFAFDKETFAAWGWRVPFLLSIVLLAVSLWMRLKLSESPVFMAMKAAGHTARNPFVESFTYPGNKKRIFVALFGVTGVLTTIWYTAFFSSLSFLKGPMRVDAVTTEVVIGISALVSMGFYLLVGKWSDRVGRKLPIVIGAALTLLLMFPLFWGMGSLANPGLKASATAAPVVVAGENCSTDPFAELFSRKQSDCGKLLETLTASGVPYSVTQATALSLSVGGNPMPLDPAWLTDGKARKAGVEAALASRGFDFSVQHPRLEALIGIALMLMALGGLSALTYGSVAALLTEMFPPQIRYSSMSIPYHIGAGYLGGFLPLIASYINARTGDAYAGLWYTWAVVAFGLVVALWGLKVGLRGISAMTLPDEKLPEPPPRALSLSLDAEALALNWRALDAMSGHAAAGAAVKADAYGVGARQAVPILRDAGCRDFFVAHWSEVAGIHNLVPPGSIAVLHGPITARDAAFAQQVGVKPVINSLHQARHWLESGGGRCDLMVDTGINRLGLPMAELGDEMIARLDIDVLMSHLASADEDVPLNVVQLGRWREARAAIVHRRASLANSAGIALGADYHGELTRPGLSLYGGIPRPELADAIRQVVRPCAAIMQVRQLQAGDTVGYNATYVAPAAMRVGVIALGYADGYLRCWSAAGRMLHGGRVLPVLGRVSMDMTVIDLRAASDIGEGDWVEAEYSLPDAAAATGLSQYELLTLLADRFAR